MIEAIGGIIEGGLVYNWVDHVANILNSNSEECHETNKIIRYSSLLIYLVMLRVCVVD